MKILTKEIEKKFQKFPFHSQDEKGENAEVILKVFNPYGRGTWLITEAEQEDGRWIGYGCMNIYEWEWGYVDITELVEARVPVFGCKMPLERDLYCKGMTVRELKAA